MPSTGPTSAAERREFRTRFPWLLLVGVCVALAALLCLAGWAALQFWQVLHDPTVWSVVLSLVVLADYLALSGAAALLTASLVLEARGRVVVGGDSMVIVGGRGRRTEVAWESVRELHLVGWAKGGGGPLTWMWLKTATGKVDVPSSLRYRAALVEEIVARAGLGELHEGRFVLTYRRTQGSTPQEESA